MRERDDDERVLLHARWTDDCNGKKDYDGPILAISTRLYPDGGGVYSGTCHLSILGYNYPDTFPDHQHILIERDFCGKSPKVFTDVSDWAQQQVDKVVKALKDAFYVDPNGSPN